MTINAVNGIQDGISLRSLAKSIQFQVVGQDVLDRHFDVFSHFMWLNWLKTAQNYNILFRIRQYLFKKVLN